MMAMPQPPRPEFTIICIDNGQRAAFCRGVYRAQIKGARLYCETVFKCNPENIVGIFTMSSKSKNFGQLVPPTSDPQQIQRALEYVHCPSDGDTEFERALSLACSAFTRSPKTAYMKRRLLMFVGCTIHLDHSRAISYGQELKASGVALDVFNFRKLNEAALLIQNSSIFQGRYHYAREELGILVTKANANANSHIVDITDDYESSVLKTLSESILEKHLDYLKKPAADDERNKSVEAMELEPSCSEESLQFGNVGAVSLSGEHTQQERKKKLKC